MNRKYQIIGIFFMLLAAFLWGTTFVAQSAGMDYVGPFTYNCCRSFVGAIILIPVAVLYERLANSTNAIENNNSKSNRRTLLIGGILCGLVLTVASGLQQVGIMYTSVGKTGFLTALYIVLVPILGLFLKKKCHLNVWISVGIAVIGLYLLCIREDFSIAPTDFFVLGCAIMYAVHILVIDHYSPKVNGIWLSSIQFFVCSILSGIIMFIWEKPNLESIIACTGLILYSGILSSGVAYTLQILGQKYLHASVAALILSSESVISVLSGWLILNEVLSSREIWGCVFMFIAIIFGQISLPKRKTSPQNV